MAIDYYGAKGVVERATRLKQRGDRRRMALHASALQYVYVVDLTGGRADGRATGGGVQYCNLTDIEHYTMQRPHTR